MLEVGGEMQIWGSAFVQTFPLKFKFWTWTRKNNNFVLHFGPNHRIRIYSLALDQAEQYLEYHSDEPLPIILY